MDDNQIKTIKENMAISESVAQSLVETVNDVDVVVIGIQRKGVGVVHGFVHGDASPEAMIKVIRDNIESAFE